MTASHALGARAFHPRSAAPPAARILPVDRRGHHTTTPGMGALRRCRVLNSKPTGHTACKHLADRLQAACRSVPPFGVFHDVELRRSECANRRQRSQRK